MFDRAKQWARAMRRDVLALWLAARDPRVPWYAKALAGVVAAYALSPIDLIPDFIPLLGYSRTHAMVSTWPLANCEGPTGLAFDAPNHLLSACDKRMVVIDSHSGQRVTEFPIGGRVDGKDSTRPRAWRLPRVEVGS